jgi:hypothetical protein
MVGRHPLLCMALGHLHLAMLRHMVRRAVQ